MNIKIRMKPHNFSWVIPNKLAASAYPFDKEALVFYAAKGIDVIINLSNRQDYETSTFKVYHKPIPDFGVPSKELMDEIIDIITKHIKRGDKILVHCIAGCGRTGMVLATWLALQQPDQSVTSVVEKLRNERSCSIESEEQLQFVKNYVSNNV